MDLNEVTEKVKTVIAQQLDIDKGELVPTAHILDDLGADSLDVVELIMALEQEFDMEIPDEEAENIQTVGDVHEYIQKRLAA